MERRIFAVTWCCDEGVDRFEEVFQADSEESVLQFMLTEIKKYTCGIEEYAREHKREPYELKNTAWHVKYERAPVPEEHLRGERYYRLINSTRWSRLVKDQELYQYINDGDWKSLESIIDNSYVDGDSSFQIRIIEVKVGVVI